MMRRFSLLLLLLVVGCAGLITAADGERVTVEHDGFVSIDRARGVALQSCIQSGMPNAEFVGSANKNPSLPRGSGVQLSTFRCLPS